MLAARLAPRARPGCPTNFLSISISSNRLFLPGFFYLLIATNIVLAQPVTGRARDSAGTSDKSRPRSQSVAASDGEQPCRANLHLEDKSLRDKPDGPVHSCNDKHEKSSTQTAIEPAPVTESLQSKSKRIEVSKFFKEEVDNYPEAEIIKVLQKTSTEIKQLYNVINTPLDPNMNLTERTASLHSDDEGREESICRSVVRNIYPREAKREDSLVYVPNTQEFMQVIQAEICQSPNEECNYLQDSLPYGMHSACVQKYSYKKLLFLDPLEKRMASDLFRYPSCCSCYVKHGSIDTRSSTSQNPILPKLQRKETGTLDDDSSAHSVPQQAPTLPNLNATDFSQPSIYHGNLTKIVEENQTIPIHQETYRQPKNLRVESILTSITTRIDHTGQPKAEVRISTTRKPDRQTRAPQTSVRTRSQTKPKQPVDIDTHSTVVLADDKVYNPINSTDR